MHYYQFNIGDYASHTRYLTQSQDLAYRRLLDLYYLHEKPIPKENPAALIGMNDCLTSVEQVLNEYFILTDKGWVNKRANEQIDEYRNKQKSASLAGKKSAEVRRANKDAVSEQVFNDRSTDVQLNIKHKPLTIKHKPIKDNYVSPVGVLPEVWQDFVQQRKAKKAAISETAIKGIEREANKAGITLNAALQEICARGWTGFKAEWVQKGNKTEHQLRQDATAKAIFGDTSVIEMEAFNVANRLD
ncbi:hypothetical protein [Caudoviricetes sp.]|nr:hypothetical protein [Caudoviricetes sp.]